MNFHGSSGYGQEFTDSITGAMGDKPLTDVMKSTDWFAQQPWIDKDRMAAAGGSYGGYMMAWLNGHTDRFKAMVCHAGVYDWHAMLASDIVKGRDRALGAPPWGDLTIVDKQSAQRFAANFKTPTLVLHGEKDLPRAHHAGAGLLQHAAAKRRADAARLLPRRESLDPEAEQLAGVAQGSVRLVGQVYRQRADEVICLFTMNFSIDLIIPERPA